MSIPLTPGAALRVASVLIESAQAISISAPEQADEYNLAALVLREWAQRPPAPKHRITAGRDRKTAQLAVHEWLLRFAETWHGAEPPSLRQTRDAAKAAAVGPRGLVDAAYRAMFPLKSRD